jgi:hypothetical protein
MDSISSMDRYTPFSDSSRRFLARDKLSPIHLPPRSPNVTIHREQFMRSIKDKCL